MAEKTRKKWPGPAPWLCASLVLILVIGGSWYGLYDSRVKEEREYQSTLERADQLYRKQIYDEALSVYKSCLKTRPDDRTVQWRIAQIYYRTEKYDQAIRSCQTLRKDQPEQEAVLLLEADCYVRKRDYPNAAKVLKLGKSSAKAQNMLREIRGKYDLDYRSMDWVSPWFQDAKGDWYNVVGLGGTAEVDDASGKTRFTGPFSYLGPVSTDRELYPARLEERFCFVDADGKRRLVPEEDFGFLGPFSDGVAVAELQGNYGFVDENFTKYQMVYDRVYDFQDGKALVCRFGEYSLLFRDFSVAKQCEFCDILEDDYGRVCLHHCMIGKGKDGESRIYNENGVRRSDFHAAEIRFPEEENGWIAYRAGKKWGYVTPMGQEIIRPTYEDAKSFSQGYAAVKLNGKWGYIDKTGELIIPCTFLDAGPISPSGTAWVSNHAGYHLLKLCVYGKK